MVYHDNEDGEKKESAVADEVLGEVLNEDADEIEEPIAEVPLDDEKAWE